MQRAKEGETVTHKSLRRVIEKRNYLPLLLKSLSRQSYSLLSQRLLL